MTTLFQKFSDSVEFYEFYKSQFWDFIFWKIFLKKFKKSRLPYFSKKNFKYYYIFQDNNFKKIEKYF